MLKKQIFTQIQMLLSVILLTAQPVVAQIVPDRTLPNNSNIMQQGNTLSITGGTTAGSNLFHSFETFSIRSGQEAHFNNSLNIQNIFSRVTGLTPSRIDGLLRANGIANLFFLNPNGIIFGPNATLNLGGSFLATTATSILFDGGSEYSAINPTQPSILTINSPIGLVFQDNKSEIIGQGLGHRLYYPTQNPIEVIFSPILGTGEGLTGLKTPPGSTLALLGGNVILDGMVVTAPSGNIEIAGISEGIVHLDQSLTRIELDYRNISNFRDIELDNLSLLDASGFGGGQIRIRGANIMISDGALITISNFGSVPSGTIGIVAAETLNLDGASFPTSIQANSTIRGIYTQTFSNGQGASIDLQARNLILKRFSAISTQTYASGNGGDIQLNIDDTLKIDGTPPIENQFLISAITTRSLAQGNSGAIQIESKNLEIMNGGFVQSLMLGMGVGGNIVVNASELITIQSSFKIGEQDDSSIASNREQCEKVGEKGRG